MLSVVIPSRHEPKARVSETVLGIKRNAVVGDRIHVVNDDGEPHGFGLAVRRGLDKVTDGLVVIMMSDGSDDPAILHWMAKKIEKDGYDLVIGSRYMIGGQQIGGPLLKRILSRWCGRLLYWWGIPTHDATNAYKMMRASRALELQLSSNGFALNLEITAKAYRLGWKITEIPVTWTDRRGGRSKFKLSNELSEYIGWFLHALV